MLGLNQTIMLALSMLVITALVGTRDLGQETLIALSKSDPGRGLVAGICVAFIAITALHWVLARVGYETMASFVIFQGVSLACLGMCSGNFGTIAMEPLAAIAGIGAALQGFISSVGAALIGALIGARFDGTTAPLALGGLLVGVASLLLVLVAERGRLFRPHHAGEIIEAGPLYP